MPIVPYGIIRKSRQLDLNDSTNLASRTTGQTDRRRSVLPPWLGPTVLASMVLFVTVGSALLTPAADEPPVPRKSAAGESKPAAAAPPAERAASDSAAALPAPPFRAQGARLVDERGREVRLTGVNWFGLETETFAPHGLWTRNWEDMLDQVVAMGFNTIRLPFSNQLLEPNSRPNGIDWAKNSDLQGLSGLEIMDKIVYGATQRGLWVILDRHRPTAAGQSELWYTDQVSEERWISDWVNLAERYRHVPGVIGADLHNEPRGPATWGSGDPKTDWRLAAERAGNAILAVNPNWLIIVQGIERVQDDWYWWGGNLSLAGGAPVRLAQPEQLVYSAHDYGPGVYMQGWFREHGFPQNLPAIWDRHWAYLHRQGIAPVLVGEFGGRSVGNDLEGTWQRSLVAYLKEHGLHYTYWTLNPNSGDTGGLLADDWQTVLQDKLALLKTYQYPRPDVLS